MDIEDDYVEQCQILKVADIKKLNDEFIEVQFPYKFYTNSVLPEKTNIGKTVYDVEADDDEKAFKFIISITREIVKEGSNVYTASEICGPLEISDTHSPNMNKVPMLSPNKSSKTKGESPATASSTNKTRPRLTEEFNDPKEIPPLKNVKIEKESNISRYSIPRGVVPVATCLTVKGAEDVLHKQFAFGLSTRDETMYFIADSEKEKEDWINSIGRSIVQHSMSVTDNEVVDYDNGR
ncbi:hypothetical protein POM88_053175 [Heracleum sosnowskyi]|uniref:PH domain-containing protein n=1 Tax=Heracleum sosnowskyi TaxID=360622 RepID=A0AAD8LYE0_9APIA|nr:hypothetical protein POM88_053175 [Heracleum sosnowskyi]